MLRGQQTRLSNAHVNLGLDLTVDETTPRLVSLVNDLGGVLAVLGLSGEGKLVLGLFW